jgi:hypothetical protein
MPGRPKGMVKKLAALEERAWHLLDDLREIWPEQYAEREGSENVADDPLCFWWNAAVKYTEFASVSLGSLLRLLEEKAGLGVEPERQRRAERGLLPREETEAAAGARPKGR